MINYKYDEEKYAKAILEQGFLTKYHSYELKILVKYLKQVMKKTAKERKQLIYEFCEKNITNFNKVKYFKVINSALNYGSKGKNTLITIHSIPITDKEIDYINGLGLEDIYKKVLFTLIAKNKLNKEMCIQKFGKASEFNFFGGKNEYYKEIHQMSKVSNKYNINNIINDLSNMGYVDVRTRGKINLLFINNIELSDNVVFEINELNNVGYYLDWHNGDSKIIKCGNDECGKLIKKTNGNMKYCRDCAKEIQQRQKNQWKQDNWKKS